MEGRPPCRPKLEDLDGTEPVPPSVCDYRGAGGAKTPSFFRLISNSTGQTPTSSPSSSTGTSSSLVTRNRDVWKYSTSGKLISELKNTSCRYLMISK